MFNGTAFQTFDTGKMLIFPSLRKVGVAETIVKVELILRGWLVPMWE